MASTTWTANRSQLVHELATIRQERDNAHAAAVSQRSRADRLAAERDALRRQLLDAETRRVDLEGALTDLRHAYDRTTAALALREAEVAQTVASLTTSLHILKRANTVPDLNATRNRTELLAALKEKP